MYNNPMKRGEQIRSQLRTLLEALDFQGVIEYATRERAVLRTLIAMTYDKTDLISWRAMDALGRLCAALSVEKVRSTVQRVLWMMREESGTNAWTGPEMLGEIVARNPGPFEDIAPIAVSFHDELIMREGALRAMYRIACVRPDLLQYYHDMPLEYLADESPLVRGYALLALAAIDREGHRPAFSRFIGDQTQCLVYDGKDLRRITLGEIAAEALGGSNGAGTFLCS